MGNQLAKMCGNSDFFQQLFQKYGDDFMKLILAQKAKVKLQQTFKQAISKLKQYVMQFETKIKSLVEGKSSQLTAKFKELKDKVNGLIPGGIGYLQQKKGQSIEQFSGFNKILTKIGLVKDQTIQKLKSEHNSVQGQLTNKKQILYDKIQQQRPKVPLYQSLNDNIKFKILDKAETEFKGQIQKSNGQTKQVAQAGFDSIINGAGSNFDKLNPQSFLTSLVQNGVKQMIGNSTGNGIGGQFGGMIGNFI